MGYSGLLWAGLVAYVGLRRPRPALRLSVLPDNVNRPALLLVVVTGNAADRLGRRLVMGCGALVMMSCAASILMLVLAGNFNPMLVLAILTLFGTARAFYGPAATSLAVNLVPREDFPNAVSWITSSWQMALTPLPKVEET